MDEWCTTTHTGSGLVDRVKASTVDEQEAVRADDCLFRAVGTEREISYLW